MSAEQIVFQFLTNQNPMLLQNWKRLLSSEGSIGKWLSCMRVLRGVANIANYDILIRLPAPGVPDGFWPIVDGAPKPQMRPIWWVSYPDIETAIPDLPLIMSKSPPFMDNFTIGEFLNFTSVVCDMRPEANITINAAGAHYGGDIHNPGSSFGFPFGGSFAEIPLVFKAYDLVIALREALRYPHVFFGTEGGVQVPGECHRFPAPLFIGGWAGAASWDNCIMMKPQNSSYRSSLQRSMFPACV